MFLVLAHDRRRVIHSNVTEHPTAEWTAAQLVQAFPWDNAPRYLLRDRDSIYADVFCAQAKCMEITEVLTAFRSPWQTPYVERLIGSIRRECLNHVVILNEKSLRRLMASHIDYYHGTRCHLSLGKDSPDGRAVQPPEMGRTIALPEVGGLHHRYERRAVCICALTKIRPRNISPRADPTAEISRFSDSASNSFSNASLSRRAN